jgi:hypothetical protein
MVSVFLARISDSFRTIPLSFILFLGYFIDLSACCQYRYFKVCLRLILLPCFLTVSLLSYTFSCSEYTLHICLSPQNSSTSSCLPYLIFKSIFNLLSYTCPNYVSCQFYISHSLRDKIHTHLIEAVSDGPPAHSCVSSSELPTGI